MMIIENAIMGNLATSVALLAQGTSTDTVAEYFGEKGMMHFIDGEPLGTHLKKIIDSLYNKKKDDRSSISKDTAEGGLEMDATGLKRDRNMSNDTTAGGLEMDATDLKRDPDVSKATAEGCLERAVQKALAI